MDTVQDIIDTILDFALDPRPYSRTCKLARVQYAAWPGIAVWQKIRCANDYFVHGTTKIALYAVGALKLDFGGIDCALENAVRADNLCVIEALMPLASAEGVVTAATFCSEKSYKMFNVDWRSLTPRLGKCRCLAELGFTFNDFPSYDAQIIIANPALNDEHLIRLLPETMRGSDASYATQLLEVAIVQNRETFAFTLIGKYGRSHLNNAYLDNCTSLRLATKLGMNEFLGTIRDKAILAGLVEELDSDGVAEVEDLIAQVKKGTLNYRVIALFRDRMADTAAEFCSNDVFTKAVRYSHDFDLRRAAATRGRWKFVDWYANEILQNYPDMLSTLVRAGYKISRKHLSEPTVDVYLAAQ